MIFFSTVVTKHTHTHTHEHSPFNRFCKAVSYLIVLAGNSCRVSLRSFVMGNKTQQSKNKLPSATGSSCCHGKAYLKQTSYSPVRETACAVNRYRDMQTFCVWLVTFPFFTFSTWFNIFRGLSLELSDIPAPKSPLSYFLSL